MAIPNLFQCVDLSVPDPAFTREEIDVLCGKCDPHVCILVFYQDGRKPQFHSIESWVEQELRKELGVPESHGLVLGRYVQEDSSVWHPFTLTCLNWEGEQDRRKKVHGNSVLRLAAWVIPRSNPRDSGCKKVEVYVTKYQRWGYTLLMPENADEIEFAKRAFGSRYEFRWRTDEIMNGNNRKATLEISNPDEFFVDPVDAHLKQLDRVVAYARYKARSHCFSRISFWSEDCVDFMQSQTANGYWFQKQQIGSLTLNDALRKEVSRHIAMKYPRCLPKLIDMQLAKKEVFTTLPNPHHIMDLRYNRIQTALKALPAPPPAAKDAPALLACRMPGVILRQEQLDVLAEMARREREGFLEDKLFVQIGESDDLELFYSPFLSNRQGRQVHGYRSRGTPSCKSGGLLLADLGWGKTVVALALIAATPCDKPTLVAVPSKVLATQWKRMCDSMTTLTSCVCTAKKQRDALAENLAAGVNVVFTTYAMLNHHVESPDGSKDKCFDAFDWKRVVYDEVHEMKKHTWRNTESCNVKWGLTATVCAPDNPNLYGIFCNLLHYEYVQYQYDTLLIDMLTVKASSSLERSWKVQETVVEYALSPDHAAVYDSLLRDLVINKWEEDSKMHVSRRHRVAAGACDYFVPVRHYDYGFSRSKRKFIMPNKLFDAESCPICTEEPENPAVLSCGHIFCENCIAAWIAKSHQCPMCRKASGGLTSVDDAKAYLENRKEDSDDVQGWRPCRALKAAELVGAVAKSEKIVVFSHYKENLFVLGKQLEEAGVGHVDMSSCSSSEALTKKLSSFDRDPECRVVLFHLASQSAGLNLMAANHVIFMEKPLEKTLYTQGVGRVARPGQTKDVSVTVISAASLGF